MRHAILNMNIGTKLMMFSLLTICLLACLSFSAFSGLKKQERLTESIFTENFKSYQVSTNLIDVIKTININAYNVLNMANVGFPDAEIEAAIKPLSALMLKTEEDIKAILADVAGDSREPLYKSILEDYISYSELMEQVVNAVTFDTDVAFASLSTAEGYYKQLNSQLVKLKGHEVESMAAMRAKAGAQGRLVSRNMIMFSVGIAFIMLVLSLAVTKSISGPVKRLMVFAEGLSGGDLTLRFNTRGRDEIGRLGATMNTMAEQIEEAMGEAEKKAHDAATTAETALEAERRAEETAQKAEAQRENILRAAEQLEVMAQGLKEASGELSNRTLQIREAITQQRDQFGETATAITQMSSTALSIASNAESASAEAGQATDEAETGVSSLRGVIGGIGKVKDNSEGLQQNMTELAGYAGEIGSIMEIITDIADQTNLLALNAAIEAARAGEAGRGFAVVADEVRKLAEKTMHATKDVGSNIASIQNSSKRSSLATEEALKAIVEVSETAGGSGEVLREILRSIHSASDGIRSIATAAEQQSATTEEITRATDSVNELTVTISEEMELAAASTSQVADLAEELHSFVETIRRS